MKTLRNDLPGPLVPDKGMDAVPAGGTFEVDDKRAEALLTDPNVAVSEAKPEPSALDRLNKDQLIELAQEKGIEPGSKTKADLIAEIEAADN